MKEKNHTQIETHKNSVNQIVPETQAYSVFSSVGRIVAGSFYDMQQIRISTLNRIRDVIRKKAENIGFKEVEKKKIKKDFIEKYTDEELLAFLPELDFTAKEIKYVERCLKLAKESHSLENKYKRAMLDFVEAEPIYKEFLVKIRGIGEVLSANLIKEFGYCEVEIYNKETKALVARELGDKKKFDKALKDFVTNPDKYYKRGYDNVAKLWAHTGNHVVNGVAVKKRKGENLTFSPRLRTFTWKISDCLMKSNHGIYREIYDSEKKKQLAREYKKEELQKKYGKTKEGKWIYKEEETNIRLIHAHNRALRKMRKLFLAHYWACARELKGLDTRLPYVQEKLGHKNIITWKKAIKREK